MQSKKLRGKNLFGHSFVWMQSAEKNSFLNEHLAVYEQLQRVARFVRCVARFLRVINFKPSHLTLECVTEWVSN